MTRVFQKPVVTTLSLCAALTILSGCNDSFVYQRSVSELNNKAAVMIAQGDAAGAVARLEAARDLMPKEPSLMYNLALAYQANKQPEKATALLAQFIEEFPNDKLAPGALKSLGVMEEAQGDAFLGQARQAKGKNDAAATARWTQQAQDSYQRAESAFSALAERSKTAEERQAVEQHLVGLRKIMNKAAAGELSPLMTSEGG
ncbi:MAG: tetratricopeptide repeat protein [Vampirovibrionales bacterium]|nr:tetratricopeptide repeat protein [Vampirovibrionales bacterium]